MQVCSITAQVNPGEGVCSAWRGRRTDRSVTLGLMHISKHTVLFNAYLLLFYFLICKIAHVPWHLNRDVQRVPQGLKYKKQTNV